MRGFWFVGGVGLLCRSPSVRAVRVYIVASIEFGV